MLIPFTNFLFYIWILTPSLVSCVPLRKLFHLSVPFFSLFSFTFIKRLFSSSSLSARRVVSSVMKEENEKVGLKFSIQKMKIMASSPIISWQIDGTKVETLEDFIFLGSKITAVTVAMKYRCLLLGREAMTSFSSVQFSSVASDSLRPHESQHARPPCPSPTPRVHSDSRPSSP